MAVRLQSNRTAKLYSPLFLRVFANNYNLRATYSGIKKRQNDRRQGKLSGKVIQSSISSELKATEATAATMPTIPLPAGSENFPPEDIADQAPWRENLNTHLICPDCQERPPNLVEENADTICGSCGMVLAERLVSYESEWRTFNSDEGKGDDPNRVGEADNLLLNGEQLATNIGGYGGSANKQARNLQRAQQAQSGDKANKNLVAAYKMIDQWVDQAQLSAVVRQSAKMFFKRVDDAKAFRGKNTEAIIAGCIFIACRSAKQARSFAEIFNLTKVPKKEIGRTYKALEKFLTNSHNETIKIMEAAGGNVNREAHSFQATQSTKPADLVGRFCAMLGLGFKVESTAKAIAEKIPTIESLAGRSPLSNAAACIYFASHLVGEGKPSKEISNPASVSDATIKHAYKFLLAEKDRLIETEWLTTRGARPANLPNS